MGRDACGFLAVDATLARLPNMKLSLAILGALLATTLGRFSRRSRRIERRSAERRYLRRRDCADRRDAVRRR
jgi:hypothetical protein